MAKPKIVICGQKPRMQDALVRAFPQVRLTFHYEDSLHQLQARARGADAVFLCINACDHKTEGAIRAAGVTPRKVFGGGTSLREALAAYLLEVTP